MAVALLSYAYSLFNPDHCVLAQDLAFALGTLPKEAERRGIGVNPERVALVGHSLGGKLSFLVAAEHRVRAVVGLDPVDGGAPGVTDPVRFTSAIAVMGQVRAPVLLLGAEYGERAFRLPVCSAGRELPQVLRGRAGASFGGHPTRRWPRGLPE